MARRFLDRDQVLRSPPCVATRADVATLAILLLAGGLLWREPPTGVAMALLLLAIGCAAVVPPAAIAAALAAAPLIFLPIDFGGRSFSLLELAIVTGSLGVGLRVGGESLTAVGRRRVMGTLRPWPISIGALALVGAATVSLFTLADAGHRDESLREFRLSIVEPLVFFGMCRWVFQERGGRWLPFAAVGVTGAILGIVAVGEVVTGQTGVVADGVRRATASYQHPNNLALFLERVGLLTAGVALVGARRPWTAPVAALCLIGILCTFSRGALLAVAVGFSALLLWSGRRRPSWRVVGALAFVAGALLFVASGRILDTGSTGEASTRELVWRASWNMALDHPIWGVGLDQFYSQYRPRYVEPAGWPERYTSHPHNILLDVWLRLGILGIAAFVTLGVAVGRLGRSAIRLRATPDAGLALGAVVALLAGAVHGMVDNAFFLPDLAVLTWFSVALLEATTRERAANSAAGACAPSVPPPAGPLRMGQSERVPVPMDSPG